MGGGYTESEKFDSNCRVRKLSCNIRQERSRFIMKKFITVMLSMVLIISCMIMPVSAFASQEITVNGDLSYEKLKMENSDNVPPVVPAEGTFGNDLLLSLIHISEPTRLRFRTA